MALPINEIIEGHVLDMLKEMPSESINCVVTSPPYWGLRAYKTEPQSWGSRCSGRCKRFTKWNFCVACGAWCGELGLEPTPELYIEHLMMVFDEVKRVLRKDGICFVNINDTYGGTPASRSNAGIGQRGSIKRWPKKAIVEKSLAAIPERFILAMMQHGWIRRCTIIWAKGLSFCETYNGSCMPDGAKDRPNKNGFEYVYMFTKNKKYWYKQQYEEHTRDWSGCGGNLAGKDIHKLSDGFVDIGDRSDLIPNPLGRIIRNVWTINPQAFSEAHFATFPEKLVEICLKMGCPEFVCKKCGKARKRIYRKIGGTTGKSRHNHIDDISEGNVKKQTGSQFRDYENVEIGRTNCGCNAGWRSGVVLDCFCGKLHNGGRSLPFAA